MSAKIYELYVDKFAQNFKGLTARLDYFNHLGINTLHILPHYPSPMVDDGYDVSDYRGIRSELGTLEDFIAFTKEAHKRGIKVITDLVINHVSSEHHWFVTARTSKHNSKRDYFLWSETGSELKDATNAFPDFKSSNWIWNEATKDYYFATFYPEQPDLNWDNPDVVEEVFMRIDFWVERGVDGFRLDAIGHLIKREGLNSYGLPETHEVIKAIRKHLDKKYGGRICLLAEIGGSVEEAQQYFSEGDECQLVYHFSLMRQMFISLMRNEYRSLEQMIQTSYDIPHNCQWATFLRNHDDIFIEVLSEHERLELLDFLDPERRYPFNKGQTTSMRLGSIFAKKPERIIEALELLYSLPGAPIMYYGDEIGMQNLPIQAGIIDTRKYVRGDFDWPTAEAMLKDPGSLLEKVAACIKRASVVTRSLPAKSKKSYLLP